MGGFWVEGCVIHSLFESKTVCVEPSGVHVLKNPNPLKDVEASAMLDVVVLVYALFWGSLYVVIHPVIKSKALAFSIFVKVKCFQAKLKQPIVLSKQPIVYT